MLLNWTRFQAQPVTFSLRGLLPRRLLAEPEGRESQQVLIGFLATLTPILMLAGVFSVERHDVIDSCFGRLQLLDLSRCLRNCALQSDGCGALNPNKLGGRTTSY